MVTVKIIIIDETRIKRSSVCEREYKCVLPFTGISAPGMDRTDLEEWRNNYVIVQDVEEMGISSCKGFSCDPLFVSRWRTLLCSKAATLLTKPLFLSAICTTSWRQISLVGNIFSPCDGENWQNLLTSQLIQPLKVSLSLYFWIVEVCVTCAMGKGWLLSQRELSLITH